MIVDLLNAPLPMAMLGAIPGALRSYATTYRRVGRARALADSLIGVVFAASLADWATPHAHPQLALLIGMAAALTGAKALDAVVELVPELVREIALGWIDRRLGGGRRGGYYEGDWSNRRRDYGPRSGADHEQEQEFRED